MFNAMGGSDQSDIMISNRPAARSSQSMNSGCAAIPMPLRSAGRTASALLARSGPTGSTATCSPEVWTKCHRSGGGQVSVAKAVMVQKFAWV